MPQRDAASVDLVRQVLVADAWADDSREPRRLRRGSRGFLRKLSTSMSPSSAWPEQMPECTLASLATVEARDCSSRAAACGPRHPRNDRAIGRVTQPTARNPRRLDPALPWSRRQHGDGTSAGPRWQRPQEESNASALSPQAFVELPGQPNR